MKLTLGSSLAGHRIVKCIWEDPSGGAIYAAYEKSEREEKDNIASCKVLSSLLAWTCVLLAIHKAAKLRKEYSKLENIIIICDGRVVFV